MIINVLKEELPEERESRFWAFAWAQQPTQYSCWPCKVDLWPAVGAARRVFASGSLEGIEGPARQQRTEQEAPWREFVYLTLTRRC